MLRADVSRTTYDKVAVISGLRPHKVSVHVLVSSLMWNFVVTTDTIDNEEQFLLLVKLFVLTSTSASFLSSYICHKLDVGPLDPCIGVKTE